MEKFSTFARLPQRSSSESVPTIFWEIRQNSGMDRECDASQVLQAALEQMDGIISSATLDCTADENCNGHSGIDKLLAELRRAVEWSHSAGDGTAHCLDPATAKFVRDWLDQVVKALPNGTATQLSRVVQPIAVSQFGFLMHPSTFRRRLHLDVQERALGSRQQPPETFRSASRTRSLWSKVETLSSPLTRATAACDPVFSVAPIASCAFADCRVVNVLINEERRRHTHGDLGRGPDGRLGRRRVPLRRARLCQGRPTCSLAEALDAAWQCGTVASDCRAADTPGYFSGLQITRRWVYASSLSIDREYSTSHMQQIVTCALLRQCGGWCTGTQAASCVDSALADEATTASGDQVASVCRHVGAPVGAYVCMVTA
ncbi:hypothetical protein HPB50_025314 [Hyalomma asiaticum]|uniref:Uncharacterized protein n=1 Tax=Hyalomma asiaticum TaxID=266040 RepID=A0ACB7SSL2_HYAAI|nr:hypothetical protein HPB50_025314 [Hyalomma asiaticum]